MIPYFKLASVSIGPLTLYSWGAMVALGIIIGAWTSARYAEKRGMQKEQIYNGAVWIIIGALIGARLVHVFAYEPGYFFAHPLDMLKIWQGGMSVIGGFAGAAAGYSLYAKKKSLNWLKTADKFIYGLPLGLGIGRIGCFLVHDHPGTPTDFFLGFHLQNGTVIHDHGLYLSLNGFILALVFYLLSKKQRNEGFFFTFFLIWYGLVRFLLDFLRVADSTYLGLTPAQFFSIIMVVTGFIIMIMTEKKVRLHPESI